MLLAGEDHWTDIETTQGIQRALENIDNEWGDWMDSLNRLEGIIEVARTLPQLSQEHMRLFDRGATLIAAVSVWRALLLSAQPRLIQLDQRPVWPPKPL